MNREQLAAHLHSIYRAEAKRQGDSRHADDYNALPENIKDFDRVLADYILERETAWCAFKEAVEKMGEERKVYGFNDWIDERDAALALSA